MKNNIMDNKIKTTEKNKTNIISKEIKKIQKERYRQEFQKIINEECLNVKKLLRKLKVDASSYYSFMAGVNNRLSISKCEIIMKELRPQATLFNFDENSEMLNILIQINKYLKSFECLESQEDMNKLSDIPFEDLETQIFYMQLNLKNLKEQKSILYQKEKSSEVLEKKFEELKDLIISKGFAYPRKYHTWYNLDSERLSYTVNLYPTFERINDAKNNISYTKRNGVVSQTDNSGYDTIYLLMINNHFIKESTNPQELWEYVSENYDLSIDYYGCISKDEIIKRTYTDTHEGNEFFIADIKNIETKESINIFVQDVLYIDNYLDDEDTQKAFDEYIEYCCNQK